MATGEFAAGAQQRLQRFGGLVVGDDEEDGLARGAGQKRKVKGTRRRGKSGHTTTPRTKVEMPLYAIEGGGALQLREDFADEGENHAFRRRNDSQLPSLAQPPSTERVWPLMKLLSIGSARNAMARAISSGVAKRPMGTRPAMSASE